MASWVEIANDALRQVGTDRIQSLDENNEAARAVRDVYEMARDEILTAHPWNCALVRAILAADATPSAWGYANAYSLPTDPYCLRVWQLERGDIKFEIGANRKLLTDQVAPLKIIYIARVTDPQLFPPNVSGLIARCIAARVAFRLTQSRSAESALNNELSAALRAARSLDGQEGTLADPDPNQDSFLEARF